MCSSDLNAALVGPDNGLLAPAVAMLGGPRRVVEITYGPGVYELDKPPRVTRVRPYAIEPSAFTRALYLIGLDESRKARRTFKVERILEASLTPETFEGSSTTIARELLAAWDVISDETMVRVVVRFSPEVAARVADMARRSYLKVLGVVENMHAFIAPDGSSHAIFGTGGGRRVMELTLGNAPLDRQVAALLGPAGNAD